MTDAARSGQCSSRRARTSKTPAAVRFSIRLLNSSPECADPQSFTLTLVDEAGREQQFKPEGDPVRTVAKGRNDRELKDVTVSGLLPLAVGPQTRSVRLRIRQRPDHSCHDVDFRWELAR